MGTVKDYDDLGLDEVEEKEFTSYDGETPKKGTYNVVVKSAEFGQSSSGNDMVTVIVEIQDDPYEGAPLWSYLVLTPSAKWKVKEFITAIGLPEDIKLSVLLKKCIGKKCKAVVYNEMYENNPTAKIKRLIPAGKATAAKKAAASRAAADDADDGDDGDDGDDEPPF